MARYPLAAGRLYCARDLGGRRLAGVTYYATEVNYLIEKSVLNLPGVKKLVFDRGP